METNNFFHLAVMLDEVIENLQIKKDGIYLDGTLGGGGHSKAIAEKLGKNGSLIGLDKDETAIEVATKNLAGYNFVPKRADHSDIAKIYGEIGTKFDGFLLDLGVSSHQLDTPSRGFSYRFDAPLDMRMDNRAKLTAHNIVNGYSEQELASIIKNYGEERFAKRIAKSIIRNRPITTTLQLSELIVKAVPKTSQNAPHPATRTFQAIRIAVNGELVNLAKTIEDMANLLKIGGRFCIITFHSLEDRIVKQTFRSLANPCQCPKDIPYCVCGKIPSLAVISKKPIYPTQQELSANPRASSAKLRVAEKIV
ncbi:MAG: 16S rRNA (cytosine(1402)-N(4))-methyltransferase RsmH [Firmicutes bacterium]|nr:16S rRNA (cytosine(1402)-N(4))-methyltransferase RsmH [Bacillota bacterium]